MAICMRPGLNGMMWTVPAVEVWLRPDQPGVARIAPVTLPLRWGGDAACAQRARARTPAPGGLTQDLHPTPPKVSPTVVR